MRGKWRVAILGLGHWYSAYNIARALREYPKAELIAVAWENEAQLAEFTASFPARGYRDYETLLAREEVDLVHLAPPVAGMAACAIAAAQAGKHLILGKPMAMTMEEADRMVAAVEAAGVKCVAFQGIKRLQSGGLKARLDAGEIGEIRVMHQTARWSIAEDWYRSGRPGWFADPRQVPGGAFIDEGIYWLDQLRWLHLKLLTARHHLINHPLDDSRKDLERKLAALRQELDVARSDKEREAKAATLAMLGQRHGNLLQREATLAEIEADLGRLHAQLDLALDNVAMRRDERPHDLALNLATIHRLIDGDIFGDDRAAVAQLEARYGVRE